MTQINTILHRNLSSDVAACNGAQQSGALAIGSTGYFVQSPKEGRAFQYTFYMRHGAPALARRVAWDGMVSNADAMDRAKWSARYVLAGEACDRREREAREIEAEARERAGGHRMPCEGEGKRPVEVVVLNYTGLVRGLCPECERWHVGGTRRAMGEHQREARQS